jgi:uncharacterized protein with ParB-like and HNH nuclease domain
MEATPTQIINYFSGFKQNLVPLFQRPYTWGERQWRTLWEDIMAFYGRETTDAKSTHFMGAVVSMPARSVPIGVSKFLVIDGQQRLTTIAMLLCAIRDDLGAQEQVPKRRIQNHYLTNDGYEGQDFFKLLPTQGDRAAYSPLAQGSGGELPDSQFKKSYEFFKRRFKELDDDGNVLDSKQILEILETRLMVVMINLSDSDDPYLIFESLNFKGSPLEQADLVRNYFLMRFPVTDQQAIYDELWLPMQNRLGSNLTEFMRHFLGSEGEEIRKGDVYAAIKRLVANSNAPSARLLMSRMAELSVFYSRLATVAPESNEDFGRFFNRFRRLDFGTAYPLLLSLYEDFADGQFGGEEFIAVYKSWIPISFGEWLPEFRRILFPEPSSHCARTSQLLILLPHGCLPPLQERVRTDGGQGMKSFLRAGLGPTFMEVGHVRSFWNALKINLVTTKLWPFKNQVWSTFYRRR